MVLFEWTLALLLAAVVLAAIARRVGAPYPAFLALAGALLALVPNGPQFALEPDLALALFVAPVLLDAAFDSSLRDLKDNWLPVGGLVLVAVGLTTAAVAVVAHALVPGLPWAAAVALGAIVAPPDAAAAGAVLRQVRPPHRIMTILEGESLLNDASALLIYRLALAAVLAGSFSVGDVAVTFLVSGPLSLVAGYLLARAYLRATRAIDDTPSAIILQFVGTFGVWILAERVGLSPILTIVAYAVTLARRTALRTPARVRVPSYAVWETTVFLLNVLAFVLVGLQLGPILSRLSVAERIDYGVVAGAVLLAVVVVRIAWVMSYNAVARWNVRRHGFHPPRPMMPPTVGGGLIISWCGMRGIVTLAAALAIPETLPSGAPFPHRDLILLTAFCVVLGTLLLQGLTLRPLLLWLDLHDGDPVAREVALGRRAVLRAALSAIDGETSPAADVLRREYEAALRQAEKDPEGSAPSRLPIDALRRRAVEAARKTMTELRARGEIGDDAFHRLEEELDWAELSAGGAAG